MNWVKKFVQRHWRSDDCSLMKRGQFKQGRLGVKADTEAQSVESEHEQFTLDGMYIEIENFDTSE